VLAKPHRHRVISQDTLRTLTEAVRRAHAARVLVTSDKSYVARYEWLSPSASDLPLHACALAIEDLLVRVDRGMIRKCSAPDCDVYFVDTSKGHRRQWCSMRNCGNREKQRRWRSGDGHRAES
jgi:predicted RNA-binding Zn ribbon-like protein